jgi:hypothetical protein
MISVEIKINHETIKHLVAVRRTAFKGWGATHDYQVSMVVKPENPKFVSDVYPVGDLEHRYCAGAVSLVEKMLKLARRKGMHR